MPILETINYITMYALEEASTGRLFIVLFIIAKRNKIENWNNPIPVHQ